MQREKTMKMKLFIACISFVFWAQYASAEGPAYTYSEFNYPGAAGTSISAINNRGEIVGWYETLTDAGAEYHGFYCADTQGGCISIDYPKAVQTTATDINDSGYIVGYYLDIDWIYHGFWYYRGKYFNFDFPDSDYTQLMSINNYNAITGWSGDNHKYVCLNLGAQCFNLQDYPGADYTYLNGVNDLGQIVGAYQQQVGQNYVTRGMLFENGNYASTIDYPNAIFPDTYNSGTIPVDVNNKKVVVGSHTRDNEWYLFSAFALDKDDYYNVEYPLDAPYDMDEESSYANGINDLGVIVGEYDHWDIGFRGYIATPPGAPEAVTILNPGFENDVVDPWTFYTNTAGSFDSNREGNGSPHAGHVTVAKAGANVQLYQPGITLKPNTNYQLSFSAYSKKGGDLSVSLFKHGAPYTGYGLADYVCNLTTTWSICSVEFTTSGFSGTVNDARLMFWLAKFAVAGEEYFIDDVVLKEAPEISIIKNPGFENDVVSPWTFYTNTAGSFDIDRPDDGRPYAGHVKIASAGTNVQLFQPDIRLEPNTIYKLSFNAYSNTGHDLTVSLIKHGPPYTNYGLQDNVCDLTTTWGTCSVEFTTSGFSGTVNDARLMFWLAPFAVAGDQYYFDNVTLVKK
jgi:hypothetical protein